MNDQLEIIDRFKKLFGGNPQAYGVYDTSTKKSITIREPIKRENYDMHLSAGTKGVGVVPVIDKTSSSFGALDYDNHKIHDGVDLYALEQKIKQIKAPLVVCRSKSGGAHVFLFSKSPLNTRILRQVMRNYSEVLTGFGEQAIEVFPKQDEVDKHLVGNWLNLPYFQGSNTERYAIINGKKAGVLEFIKYAESNAVDTKELLELGSETHSEAPVCMERLFKEKLDEGNRNIAIYNACIYTRKAFPDSWESIVYKYNAENFITPLSHSEVTKVMTSIQRNPGYRYKCSEEPCKSRCDSSKCVLRKWGITPTERNDILMTELPKLGKLKKYLTDPVRYELTMEGKKLMLSSVELLQSSQFRRVVFEQLDRVVKPIKPDVWLNIVDGLIKKVELIDVPDDASRAGIIRSLLLDYIKQANLKDTGEDVEKRKHITNGRPVVQKMPDGIRYVLFRGMDFRKVIQSKRLGNLVGVDIWMAVKDAGAKAFSLRYKQKVFKVWGVPLIDENPDVDIPKDDCDIDYSAIPEIEDLAVFKPEF